MKRKNDRRRREKRILTAVCVALVAVIVALSAYAVWWYANRGRIRADADRYREMYVTDAPTAAPVATDAPAIMATPIVTEIPTATPVVTEMPTATPVVTGTPIVTEAPTDTPTVAPTERPTDQPTAEPSDEPTPVPHGVGDMPRALDLPIATPDAGTRIYALPTPPPVQDSFAALLEGNPDTVGFLDIESMLSLPVVQRENDNDHYLNHTFDGLEASEGALFLDGTNRLVPEDDCLIVYGHNMKNGTMFGHLARYERADYLRQHPIIRFDTIYENRSYVPFAAFSASMDPDNGRYFDVRQFIFDEQGFDLFTMKLRSRSRLSIPVDVAYGDRLLLLVTCDYTNAEGRFILALRQLRPDETEADLWAKLLETKQK